MIGILLLWVGKDTDENWASVYKQPQMKNGDAIAFQSCSGNLPVPCTSVSREALIRHSRNWRAQDNWYSLLAFANKELFMER